MNYQRSLLLWRIFIILHAIVLSFFLDKVREIVSLSLLSDQVIERYYSIWRAWRKVTPLKDLRAGGPAVGPIGIKFDFWIELWIQSELFNKSSKICGYDYFGGE